eukprot:5737224-Heterocapsa_arctica.AAC.1
MCIYRGFGGRAHAFGEPDRDPGGGLPAGALHHGVPLPQDPEPVNSSLLLTPGVLEGPLQSQFNRTFSFPGDQESLTVTSCWAPQDPAVRRVLRAEDAGREAGRGSLTCVDM